MSKQPTITASDSSHIQFTAHAGTYQASGSDESALQRGRDQVAELTQPTLLRRCDGLREESYGEAGKPKLSGRNETTDRSIANAVRARVATPPVAVTGQRTPLAYPHAAKVGSSPCTCIGTPLVVDLLLPSMTLAATTFLDTLSDDGYDGFVISTPLLGDNDGTQAGIQKKPFRFFFLFLIGAGKKIPTPPTSGGPG